jgi:hypothetical protein
MNAQHAYAFFSLPTNVFRVGLRIFSPAAALFGNNHVNAAHAARMVDNRIVCNIHFEILPPCTQVRTRITYDVRSARLGKMEEGELCSFKKKKNLLPRNSLSVIIIT